MATALTQLQRAFANAGLVNVRHDQKVFTWTAGDLTKIEYKLSGATVATVVLTWTAGDLTDMTVS